MELTTALGITKSFNINTGEYTPTLSDDWTYSFFNFSKSTTLELKSEKLNASLSIIIDLNHFFRKYIFTEIISISKNNLIGEFAVNKDELILKDEFLEAETVVAESFVSVIPNNELIENGLYLDDKGDQFLYLGNFEYKNIIINDAFHSSKYYTPSGTDYNNLSFQNIMSNKKRWILKYNGSFSLGNGLIQKTSKRKFIKFIKILNLAEQKKAQEGILYHTGMFFIRSSGNKLNILEKKEVKKNYFSNGFYKQNDYFGYYAHRSIEGKNGRTFFILDFEKFKSDLISNKLASFEDYLIERIDDFQFEFNPINSFDNETGVTSIRFYLDYEL